MEKVVRFMYINGTTLTIGDMKFKYQIVNSNQILQTMVVQYTGMEIMEN